MKNIYKLTMLLILVLSLNVEAKSFEEKRTDLIYLGNVFKDIVFDDSTQNKPVLYGTLYKKNNPPSVNMAKKALLYLRLNEKTSASHGSVSGWNRVENVHGREGMFAAVFQKNNQTIIAFRGAEVGVSDWITDGQSQNNEIAAQYYDALELVERYIADYPHHDIVVTGYSLGGALATFAGLATNQKIYTFNHLALNQRSIDFIEDRIASSGNANDSLMARARNVLNFHFAGEFVADGDRQEDGDTIFKHQIIGDTYYISDRHFHAIFYNNKVFRHLFPPLKEELSFLSNPYYRNNMSNLNLKNNQINTWRERFYFDYTWDDYDLFRSLNHYILDSIPSLIRDIIEYGKH